MKTPSQRGRAAKQKGKAGEREVAELLRAYGFEARRGVQYTGGGDSPDVVSNLPGCHIEVKRTETLQLWPAMAQAAEDSKPGEAPLVFHRPSKRGWIVIMNAEDFLGMMQRATHTSPLMPQEVEPINDKEWTA